MGYTDRLSELHKALNRSREISEELEPMKTYRDALEQKVKALKRSLKQENQDVEDLEASKVISLVLSLRGKLEGRMEKEKAQALAIKLKFEQSVSELSELNGRIAVLTEEQAGLESCRPEYEQLFEQKKQRLIREDNAGSHRIAELSENLERTRSMNSGICAALKAAEETLKLLDFIMDDLKKADLIDRDYDSPDFGYTKRDYFERAAEYAGKAQRHFNTFKITTANIGPMNDPSVTTGLLVADILFEDLIANWYEPYRADRSKTNVETVKCEIYCDILRLNQLSEETKDSLDIATKQLDEMVLGAA